MKPKVFQIAACDKNGVLGIKGKLPWHLPLDLQYFKNKTKGCPIIMGRKTFESIGRPLPSRQNIVITRNPDSVKNDGVDVVSSVSAALDIAKPTDDRIWIVGGGEIYNDSLEITDSVYLTRIDLEVENGDAFYPLETLKKGWEAESSEQFSNNGIIGSFEVWNRKR